ncbi:11425_t:CDS:2, partial [Ambispora leptoticha]
MKKAKKSLSTHPTTTRPSTPITRSTTIRPTTSNTQLSTAESATSITQPNTNIPITSTTQLSTTESATTRSSTNNDRPTQLSIAESATSTTQSNTNIPATSTTQSSTNRDRPITSNTQLYIAESATSTTQSGTNQPAIFTTQPTTTSQITPSRHTNVLLSFSSSSSSSSSPIIQEEYERDTMRRNRKFEELENENLRLWKVINELHGVTLRQDRNIMGITDQINYLMSSVSTLIDDIDELYDLSQSDDQDSFEWVMEESSTNALRRSAPEATTRLNTIVDDDMDRKRRKVFLNLKEKGTKSKDKMAENTFPVFFSNLGDRYKTSRHKLAEIRRQYPTKSSRNTLSIHQDPFHLDDWLHINSQQPEKMTRHTEAFRYFSIKNGKRTNKYDLDELRKLLNKSDHESSDAEERDENSYASFNLPDISRRSDKLSNLYLDAFSPNYVRPHRKSFFLNLSAPEDLLDWEMTESDDECDEESDNSSSDNSSSDD